MARDRISFALSTLGLYMMAAAFAPQTEIGRELSNEEMAHVMGDICFVYSALAICPESCTYGSQFEQCTSSPTYKSVGTAVGCPNFYCLECNPNNIVNCDA
jgi:hypothetical protein